MTSIISDRDEEPRPCDVQFLFDHNPIDGFRNFLPRKRRGGFGVTVFGSNNDDLSSSFVSELVSRGTSTAAPSRPRLLLTLLCALLLGRGAAFRSHDALTGGRQTRSSTTVVATADRSTALDLSKELRSAAAAAPRRWRWTRTRLSAAQNLTAGGAPSGRALVGRFLRHRTSPALPGASKQRFAGIRAARVAAIAMITTRQGSGASRSSVQEQRRQSAYAAYVYHRMFILRPDEFERTEWLNLSVGAVLDDEDDDFFSLLRRKNAACDDDDAAVAAPEPTHADTPMPMTFEEYWNTRGSMVHSAITRGHDQTSEAGGDGGVVGGSR